jgi:CheY-like chemotaxis protein
VAAAALRAVAPRPQASSRPSLAADHTPARDTRVGEPPSPAGRQPVSVESAASDSGSARDTDKPDRRSPAIVLVVEDSPVNRLVAGRVLERAGFRTQLVDDALQALEALDVQQFDAILMDCQMPGMDGYEATRELRRRESAGGRHTPVIAMTAHAMTGDRERCLDAGMDDYITKPVRSQVLVEVLQRWIGDERVAGAYDEDSLRVAAVP